MRGAAQARALFEAPEGAPHLLPFYARVAASLAQVFPDVTAALLRYLEEEFAALQVCIMQVFTLAVAFSAAHYSLVAGTTAAQV